MSARRSIEIPGFGHGNLPIPAASRVGPMVVTGGIFGLDREAGIIPDGVEEQARLMFDNLAAIMAAAGGSMDSIVRMTVYVRSPEARAAVNAQWIKAFPDAGARPARHTLAYDGLAANMLVQCDAIAFVAEAA